MFGDKNYYLNQANLPEFQSPRNRVKCSEDSFDNCVKLQLAAFQSPRNRVKCSESETTVWSSRSLLTFQSPRNRVKCSENRVIVGIAIGRFSFNPLEIGSSVRRARDLAGAVADEAVSIP